MVLAIILVQRVYSVSERHVRKAVHPWPSAQRAIFCLPPERTGSMVDPSSSWVAQLQLGIPLRPCRKLRDQQSGHTAIPLAVQFPPL
jgi:hypothetical protein